MFTGIVEETGNVHGIRKGSTRARLTITARNVLDGTKTGDSICVNGVCLTVTELTVNSFSMDVMPETMSRSSLGDLRVGSPVNLERALRLSDRLGGHLVSGHIDGTGRIATIREDENAIWYTIDTSPEIMRYIIDKGSVAIDGISLTVVNPQQKRFEVSVIPHSLKETNLHTRKTGDRVNIECDLIGKYVEKLTKAGKGGISREFLYENGF